MHPKVEAVQLFRLKEISLKLRHIHCNQSSLTAIENLFFDVLAILRGIGTQTGENLLDNLLSVKANEYQRTQEHYRSVKTIEKTIKQFRSGFKRALDKTLSSHLFASAPVH
jgi:hypothetical protein